MKAGSAGVGSDASATGFEAASLSALSPIREMASLTSTMESGRSSTSNSRQVSIIERKAMLRSSEASSGHSTGFSFSS